MERTCKEKVHSRNRNVFHPWSRHGEREKRLLSNPHPHPNIRPQRHRIPKGPDDPNIPQDCAENAGTGCLATEPCPEPLDEVLERDGGGLPEEELDYAHGAFAQGDVGRGGEDEEALGVHEGGDEEGEPELGVGREG